MRSIWRGKDRLVAKVRMRAEAPGRGLFRALNPATVTLTLSQALYFMGVSVDLTLTGIVGLELAPERYLATAPLASILVAGSVFAFVTGPLAQRYGYVVVLGLGGLVAVLGGLVSACAVYSHSFVLLCVGTGLVGVYRATGGYIRYLAADLAPPGGRERALALILYGGLVAAFLGPFAATWSASLLQPMYAGAYLLVAVFAGANCIITLFLPRSRQTRNKVNMGTGSSEQRTVADSGERLSSAPTPLRSVVTDANFQLALVALVLSGALMTTVMAVGPIASKEAGHSDEGTALMIQWHLVGMFAPAIVSSAVIAKIGPRWTGALGSVAILVGGALGIGSMDVVAMTFALLLNGIGWNFLYLSGSTLLIRCYPPNRGGRIQGFAEGVSSLATVLSSISASGFFFALGWSGVNVPVFIVAGVIAFLLLAWRRHSPVSSVAAGTLN